MGCLLDGFPAQLTIAIMRGQTLDSWHTFYGEGNS